MYSLRAIKDKKEREEIVSSTHAGQGDLVDCKVLRGHLGYDKTEEMISRKVWWPCIRNDVRSYIKACYICQNRRSRAQIERVIEDPRPLRKKPKPHPWSNIEISSFSMHTSEQGYTCLVIAVDNFSKWTEAKALHRKSAEGVSNFLYKCICRHGHFDVLINDSHEFKDSVSRELFKLTGVKPNITSPSLPQSNEKCITTIQDIMMRVFNDASLVDDWPKALPGILYTVRTSKPASEKYSPFFLLYGREPKQPGLQTKHSVELTEEEINQAVEITEQHIKQAEEMTEHEIKQAVNLTCEQQTKQVVQLTEEQTKQVVQLTGQQIFQELTEQQINPSIKSQAESTSSEQQWSFLIETEGD